MGAGAARGLQLLTQLPLPFLATVSALGCGKGAGWASAGGFGGRLKGSAKGLGAEMGFGQTGLGCEGVPTWLGKSRVPVKGRPTWLEKGPETWWMVQHVQGSRVHILLQLFPARTSHLVLFRMLSLSC